MVPQPLVHSPAKQRKQTSGRGYVDGRADNVASGQAFTYGTQAREYRPDHISPHSAATKVQQLRRDIIRPRQVDLRSLWAQISKLKPLRNDTIAPLMLSFRDKVSYPHSTQAADQGSVGTSFANAWHSRPLAKQRTKLKRGQFSVIGCVPK